MIVHGVVAVHREDSAKRVSVNGVNSNDLVKNSHKTLNVY